MFQECGFFETDNDADDHRSSPNYFDGWSFVKSEENQNQNQNQK